MPNEMQFMDCPHCGKRVRTTADRCHRCGQVPAVAVNRTRDIEVSHANDEEGSQSHHALRMGGYRVEDDEFDYDAFLEEEFGERTNAMAKPWWWYVAWCVLIVFVLGMVSEALLLTFPIR